MLLPIAMNRYLLPIAMNRDIPAPPVLLVIFHVSGGGVTSSVQGTGRSNEHLTVFDQEDRELWVRDWVFLVYLSLFAVIYTLVRVALKFV